MLKRVFILLLLSILLLGCKDISEKEEDKIVQRSTQLAKAYFKEKLGYEIVVNKHEFTTRTNGTEIYIYGYEKGDKENKISATIDYSGDEYKVQMVGTDKKVK
ncbi:hypothetical protein IHV10_09585 [Fictibacillus sp. 5RED26]|uniref:hypothetical protein n=1 Tax=Fictibacillus sp. 5RED26 TaxID=2745876 RepID=UPI0018CCFAF1|nr:hypothetical protein [Fictibacillus sp. 5RED26]MBH0156619.1 hypothetical protein [Fictibacillus sp. 5RED26]